VGAAVTTPPGHTAALASLTWTAPSTYQDNRIHHLYQRAPLVDAGVWRPEAEPFRDMLEALGPVHDAWATRCLPGGYVVPHTDASRWRERWQIPLQTAGFTWLGETGANGEMIGTAHPVGVPFRVRQWLPHAVSNEPCWPDYSDRDRIHLIIDLDRYVGPDQPAPFRIL
jgi:hypothetical protein